MSYLKLDTTLEPSRLSANQLVCIKQQKLQHTSL